jgi:hypothetical protein
LPLFDEEALTQERDMAANVWAKYQGQLPVKVQQHRNR